MPLEVTVRVTWPWRLLGLYLALVTVVTAWILVAGDKFEREEAFATYVAPFALPWGLWLPDLFSVWSPLVGGILINAMILLALGFVVRRRPA